MTRLIVDTHDAAAFAPVAHLTVGDFRNWLLSDAATSETLAALAPGLTPEMVAAVSKICRLQDLALIARKCRVLTRFRGTIGLAGRMATRLQPNHPTDAASGIAASLLDGLLHGSGDAVIGHQPRDRQRAAGGALAADARRPSSAATAYRRRAACSHHVTNTIQAIERGRAGRPGVPVHRWHRGHQQELRQSTSRCSVKRARRRCP